MSEAAYEIHLDLFEGPLDLLLYLVKKSDMEIAEIPLAQITTEYLQYLGLMKELNLDIAGDFMVMAATLMQLKARMLLPSPEPEEEEGPDPLEELKARLAEYQKFKEVAQVLSSKEMESSHIYYRTSPAFPKDDFILESSLFELIDAFKNVLTEMPANIREIVYEEIPIEQKIREVLDLLEGKQYVHFLEIMKLQKTRHDMIVCFMAILELIRLKQILARQTEHTEDIRIYRVQMPVTEPAVHQPEQELFVADTANTNEGAGHGEDGSQADR
jgi:segregation and condensation protein A